MVHRKSSSVSVSGQRLSRENLQDGEDASQRAEAVTPGQAMSGHSAGDSGSGTGGDASQRLDAVRTALLRSKQAELDAIEDKHDDLVRLSPLLPRILFSGGRGGPACAFLFIVCGLYRYARRFIWSGGPLWLRMTLQCVSCPLSFSISSGPFPSLIDDFFLTFCGGQVAKKDNTAVFQEARGYFASNWLIDVFTLISSLSQNTISSGGHPRPRAHPVERLGVRTKTALRS